MFSFLYRKIRQKEKYKDVPHCWPGWRPPLHWVDTVHIPWLPLALTVEWGIAVQTTFGDGDWQKNAKNSDKIQISDCLGSKPALQTKSWWDLVLVKNWPILTTWFVLVLLVLYFYFVSCTSISCLVLELLVLYLNFKKCLHAVTTFVHRFGTYISKFWPILGHIFRNKNC